MITKLAPVSLMCVFALGPTAGAQARLDTVQTSDSMRAAHGHASGPACRASHHAILAALFFVGVRLDLNSWELRRRGRLSHAVFGVVLGSTSAARGR